MDAHSTNELVEEGGWVFCDGKGCLNGTCARCIEEMKIIDKKQQDAVARAVAFLEEMAKLQTKGGAK